LEEKGGARSKPITDNVEMLFHLNKLDLLRLAIDSSSFQMGELEGCLRAINKITQSSTIDQQYRLKYLEYVGYVVTEITLKLLRQGNTDCWEKLKSYLSEKVRVTLSELIRGDLPSNSEANIGEVYELYCHIAANGMQSISGESLEKFISKD
jgi:hypothetical protein